MRRLLAPLLFLWAFAAQAQHLLIVEADSALPHKWAGPWKLANAAAAPGTVADVRNTLIAHGYLEASCDSCATSGDTTRCFFHRGPAYKWARLSAGTVPPEIASATGFRERLYRDRPITPRQMGRLFESLLDECENNGHPFATIGLDSLQATSGGLVARLVLDRGRRITVDSIVVKGDARIGARYLHAQIGIRPGDLYNESLIAALDKRLRELPFITMKQPPYVLFTQEETKLYLFLNGKKASSFNGILGVQPDPATGEVRLTGDLDLKLRSALHRGEAIDLNWRSLQDKTQDLSVRFNLPFALGTPFGTDLSLKLFKRDTTFLEVTSRAALEYLLPRGDKVSVFVNNKNSQRLGQQVVFVPGLADVKITAYGLGVLRERYDYRFNPRRGLGIQAEGSVGNKRTSTSTFSDTARTEVRTVQYQLDGKVVWHIPVGKKGTVRLAAQGGSMLNPASGTGQATTLYQNELYRIGGIKTMRGVDEASIYCSSYAIGTIEYRFLFEENSNLFLFVDQGWWENRSTVPLVTDAPLGFGVGTSFETKAGIFALSYALGKQFNNPIELRGGKVHFGFTSLF
ncbi:MAG: BamA/TamA family outer membrane protein [Flavobacteriales bacterium]